MKTNNAFSNHAGRFATAWTTKLLPLLLLLLILSVSGAQGAVVFTTLHSFTGTNDGGYPDAALVQGSDGYFYGTTCGFCGGPPNNSVGTVFKISTNGALTTLYAFGTVTNASGFPLDGANPQAGLVQGSDGYFYGTTTSGGVYANQYGNDYAYGTVFKISPTGALTTLYAFGSVQDTNGNALDGGQPAAGLVQGSDGNSYGTTESGGMFGYVGSVGYGTVFEISPAGALTTLYSFGTVINANGDPLDGRMPLAGLVQGSDGYFYGTTLWGGTNDAGTVFKINTSGVLTTLYSFNGTNDGSGPNGLVQGSDGNFYGTTEGPFCCRGSTNLGTVFKISANGALTTLHSFTGGNDFGWPVGLVQGSDGYFYGTTGQGTGVGTVFRISINGALTTLYSFTGGNDGGTPNGLVRGGDGNFYGTTTGGGVSGAGTVFRLTIVPQPQLTIVPSGPYVILAWPTNYSGFTLQSTPNLGASAVWSTNSSPPVVIGGENVVINTITGRQQFYRLSQ
jgi:uncharacterized repeat protein (TIGR03803 family)